MLLLLPLLFCFVDAHLGSHVDLHAYVSKKCQTLCITPGPDLPCRSWVHPLGCSSRGRSSPARAARRPARRPAAQVRACAGVHEHVQLPKQASLGGRREL